jgi:hypothetical protein
MGLETACTQAHAGMASFPNLRTTNAKPSDASEGVCVSAIRLLAGTAAALSELATHPGTRTVPSAAELTS